MFFYLLFNSSAFIWINEDRDDPPGVDETTSYLTLWAYHAISDFSGNWCRRFERCDTQPAGNAHTSLPDFCLELSLWQCYFQIAFTQEKRKQPSETGINIEWTELDHRVVAKEWRKSCVAVFGVCPEFAITCLQDNVTRPPLLPSLAEAV